MMTSSTFSHCQEVNPSKKKKHHFKKKVDLDNDV